MSRADNVISSAVSPDFSARCTSCGSCTGACALLGKYGDPGSLTAQSDPPVFLCTNCGACDALCPLGLPPSAALLAAKHRLIMMDKAPWRVSRALASARRFVRRGASFPFSFHSRTRTVFWPGCSLAGMSPDVTIKIRRMLSRSLENEVGLALDCCGDPACGLGDLGTAEARLREISRTFRGNGVSRVIAGCANCVKILRGQIPGVQVDHVLEALPEGTKVFLPPVSIYLHHPCPSYRHGSIQDAARRLCGSMQLKEQAHPLCCGQGGGVQAISRESADACADEVIRSAGSSAIMTYCMGCKDQFLRHGKQTYHLLELIAHSKIRLKPVSSARHWLNRLVLVFRSYIRNGIV